MYYGIDIGGTSAKIGAFKDDNLVKTWSIPMDFNNVFDMVDTLINSIKEFDSNIEGIGVDCPGFIVNNYNSSSANLHYLDNLNLKDAFLSKINTKVRVINDANSHALGEAIYNKEDNILFVTLGTGVGGGFVLNNGVLEGNTGAFMEIGHTHVDNFYNFNCGCGSTGCLETVCGKKGVINLVNYYKDKLSTSLKEEYEVKDVFDLAKIKDPLCLKVFEVFTDKLALALANASIILNPKTIIIGGGISLAGDFLLDKIKKDFKKYARGPVINTNIKLASLGSLAGIYGAYYLVR